MSLLLSSVSVTTEALASLTEFSTTTDRSRCVVRGCVLVAWPDMMSLAWIIQDVLDKSRKGALISNGPGKTTSYALAALEPRGRLFVGPGVDVYVSKRICFQAARVLFTQGGATCRTVHVVQV